MKLPFLKNTRWPRIREDEDRVVNPSSDAQLQDHLTEQLMVALEKKDQSAILEALEALILSIQNEDQDDV